MQAKKVVGLLVLVFAALYYVGRLGIFFAGATGEMAFEEEQTALVENVVSYSFLLIGVMGLLMLPGWYLRKTWGLWGTITVSAYTIALDVWAFALVQTSAIAGVIPAAMIAGYLLLIRKEFASTGSN